MSKDQYYCKILNGAENSICLLLAIFKSVLNRTEGYGMKKQKFHQQIHGSANKDYFSSPNNVDSRLCKIFLKIHAKAPSWALQKQDEAFHQ